MVSYAGYININDENEIKITVRTWQIDMSNFLAKMVEILLCQHLYQHFCHFSRQSTKIINQVPIY